MTNMRFLFSLLGREILLFLVWLFRSISIGNIVSNVSIIDQIYRKKRENQIPPGRLMRKIKLYPLTLSPAVTGLGTICPDQSNPRGILGSTALLQINRTPTPRSTAGGCPSSRGPAPRAARPGPARSSSRPRSSAPSMQH